MADFNGTDLNLYVSASAPTPADISTQYTKLGALTNVTLDESFDEIEISTKDDGDNSEYTSGRHRGTVTFTARYDKEDDSGQAVINTVRAGTTRALWFLISSNTSGDNEWFGGGILTNRSISMPDNDTVEMNVTIRINGVPTEQSATTTT